ncbi:thioredoxin family protein [Allohahella sp. A8]|uniref:thioredoxin family protein n=1 Tax=Allohahella sp. A8 TaxID=3141461 RepID=UPI000C09214C|nr:thiol reductase thioredoxin [Hahellaceae bacterium]
MTMSTRYEAEEPALADVEAMKGPALIEFGTPWCGHCQAAQAHLNMALSAHPEVPHLKIEDGKGKPLGRAFRVKLWPTLVFLKDGQEINRLVRPVNDRTIKEALASITD